MFEKTLTNKYVPVYVITDTSLYIQFPSPVNYWVRKVELVGRGQETIPFYATFCIHILLSEYNTF